MTNPHPVEYFVHTGNDPFNKLLKRRVYFKGNCFGCGSEHHIQAHCPLVFCTECKRYGHVSRVCKKKTV